MHGFIFNEVGKYVTERLGLPAWQDLLQQAGLGVKSFHNYLSYPDEELVALVVKASEVTGLTVPALLEDFGEYLAGDLVRVYRPLIDPDWKTLDFLANAERVIHHVVRARNRQARPPSLVCARTRPDEVLILYTSPRKLCHLARGIVRGTARHYQERIEVLEETCMHKGDPACRIFVHLLSA